jgi:hypothetical protein
VKWLFIIPTVLFLVGGLVISLFPKLVTGDYCQVTIDSIQIEDNGLATIAYTTMTSNGTCLASRYTVDGAIQGGASSEAHIFPPRPSRGAHNDVFALDPDLLRPFTALDQAPRDGTRGGRIKVMEKQTYDVWPDEPLTLYHFEGADGKVYEGILEIQ